GDRRVRHEHGFQQVDGCGDGRGRGRLTTVFVFTVTFGALANALLLLCASSGTVLTRITIFPTAHRIVAIAVTLVGVVSVLVRVGIEAPGDRRRPLGNLEVWTVWNGASTGHGPRDTNLPGRGHARGRDLPADFRNRL